jgi:hypothetical protein
MSSYFQNIGAQPPVTDTNANNAWMAERNAAFSAWLGAYQSDLSNRGFSVSLANAGGETLVYTTASYSIVTLTRNGFSVERVVSMNTAEMVEPSQAAESDANAWGYAYAQSSGVNPFQQNGQLPAPVTPGPSTTVQTAGGTGASTLPAQSPTNPNSGTLGTTNVAPAQTPQLETVHGWNYYWNQSTGQVGPAPEEIGVASNARITRDEWWSLVSAWISAQIPASGGDVIAPGGVDEIPIGGGGASDSGSTDTGSPAGGGGGVSGGGGGAPSDGGGASGGGGGVVPSPTPSNSFPMVAVAIGGALLLMALTLRR